MIIFDEYSYALEVEKEKITDSYNALKKGSILAKLYFSQGYTEEEVYKKLSDKFSILDDSYNYIIKHSKINIMISMAKKSPELKVKEITFSSQELEKIKSFKNNKMENFLFIMLSIYKFNDGKFYVNEREVFRLAHISWTGTLFNDMIAKLHDLEIINVSISKLMGTKSSKIMFEFTEEFNKLNTDTALTITDYRNLIYQYYNYFQPNDYIKCEKCGQITPRKSNRQKYCNACR